MSYGEEEAFRRIRAASLAATRDLYVGALGKGGEPELRKIAQQRLQSAGYFIEAAFNLTNDPACPYSFDEEVRLEAMQAIVQLIRLLKRPMRCTSNGLAAQDPAFQRFMQPVIAQPRRRRPRKGGTP